MFLNFNKDRFYDYKESIYFLNILKNMMCLSNYLIYRCKIIIKLYYCVIMKKILVDTNCIIYIVKNKIDFFEEINKLIQEPFEIYVTESVINELEKISTKKTKNSMFARIALMIIKKNKFKIIKGKYMNADKDILYITNKNWIVITNDKRLKRLLSQKNTRAISVREFVKIDF